MFNLTLRQAQTAFGDGRLSEACELAQRDEVRRLFAGQKLITKLIAALVERSGRHHDAGRHEDALLDCEMARRLDGRQEHVEALRQKILAALAEERARKQRHEALVAATREQLRQGRLSAAGRLLDGFSQAGASVAALGQNLAARQTAAAGALERARAAMNAHAWDAAIDAAQEARRACAGGDDVRALVSELTQRAAATIREALVRGRLDTAGALAARLRTIARDDLRLVELESALSDCASASRALAQGGFAQASRLLARAKQVLPEAVWIDGAMERAQRAMRELEAVQAGPLGLLDGTLAPQGERQATETQAMNSARKPDPLSDPPRGSTCQSIGSRFVLSVDGVGAFLVVCEAKVTLGPVSHSTRPTIGLLAPPDTPMATIERRDEDYVLRGERPVKVNEEAATSRVLLGGERIELSPRCRMTFLLPNAASTTAVLRLSGAKLPRRDIRQVILMDRSLVLGATGDAHVRTMELPGRTVLFLQSGALHCRSEQAVEVDGMPADAGTPITAGARVRIGDVSLAIRAWE